MDKKRFRTDETPMSADSPWEQQECDRCELRKALDDFIERSEWEALAMPDREILQWLIEQERSAEAVRRFQERFDPIRDMFALYFRRHIADINADLGIVGMIANVTTNVSSIPMEAAEVQFTIDIYWNAFNRSFNNPYIFDKIHISFVDGGVRVVGTRERRRPQTKLFVEKGEFEKTCATLTELDAFLRRELRIKIVPSA